MPATRPSDAPDSPCTSMCVFTCHRFRSVAPAVLEPRHPAAGAQLDVAVQGQQALPEGPLRHEARGLDPLQVADRVGARAHREAARHLPGMVRGLTG